ncbi:hypothetical protein IFM89_029703 [Coptis chinensis]|uniref:C2H2-type domain-containing protein n=1 Tax=Coptis chinensis TaxID=261450 RepID=A0A835M7C6_9MAGN|nr:hypothetical protein IFM89_029703 [Coptis chinensis]
MRTSDSSTVVSVENLKNHFSSSPTATKSIEEALDFVQNKRSWKCWTCCLCDKRFAASSLYLDHMTKHLLKSPLPQKYDITRTVVNSESEWYSMIIYGTWKPINVKHGIEMASKGYEELLLVTDGTAKKKARFLTEYLCSHWLPLTDDSDRLDSLLAVRERLRLLVCNKLLADTHLKEVMRRTLEMLACTGVHISVFRKSGLEHTHLPICFLETSGLKELVSYLTELYETAKSLETFGLIPNGNIPSCQSEGKRVVLSGDGSFLMVDEPPNSWILSPPYEDKPSRDKERRWLRENLEEVFNKGFDRLRNLCKERFDTLQLTTSSAVVDSSVPKLDMIDVRVLQAHEDLLNLDSTMYSCDVNDYEATISTFMKSYVRGQLEKKALEEDRARINGGTLRLNEVPLTLGLETVGGVMTKLIPRKSIIPVKKSQVFSTFEGHQTTVSVKIFEGERSLTKDCQELATFYPSGIVIAPRKTSKIEVTFGVDANGVLKVKVADKATCVEETITIPNYNGHRSQEQIDGIVREAETFAEADKKVIKKIHACNNLETYIYGAMNKLTDGQAYRKEYEDAVMVAHKWFYENPNAAEDAYVYQLHSLAFVVMVYGP